MKHLFVLLVTGIILQACQGTAGEGRETASEQLPVIEIAAENLGTVSFEVEGMTCSGCENAIKRSIESLDGIGLVEASHETGKAIVNFDRTVTDDEALKARIEASGYRVTGTSASK